MTASTIRPATVNVPSEEAIVDTARSLLGSISERRASTYAQRHVSEETISELKQSGLFRLLQPKRYGGYESNYRTVMRVTEALASACPSTGWVFGVLSDHQWIMSLYPERAQDEVWADDPDTLISSCFAPRATAQRVDGGYRVSGKWSFSSGCDHSRWAMLGAFVLDEQGKQITTHLLIPMTDLVTIDDWFVLGLNGSGSKSLTATDIFVPDYRAVTYDQMNTGTSPGRAVHPNYDMCRAPRRAFTIFTLSPVMVSIARQTYAMVTDRLRDRVARGVRVAEQQSVQLKVAEAGALIDIAAMVIQTRYEQGMGYLAAGSFPDGWDLASHRDVAYATAHLRTAVEMLCSLTGGSVVYNNDPLQQLLRDAITASSHRGVNWDNAGGGFGRFALGLS